MAKMKDLYDVAGKIKDVKLRKTVLDTLKDPGKLSGQAFAKCKPCSLAEAPASTNFHHIYAGGLVDHVYSVTRMAMEIAKVLEDAYSTKIDHDSLIAAALLHDIGKLWKMKKDGDVWSDTELKLDHTMLWTSELYTRGFSENIIHIVASHFGPEGPTPPMTIEAVILHEADNFDAKIGTVDQDSLLQQILAQVNDERG